MVFYIVSKHTLFNVLSHFGPRSWINSIRTAWAASFWDLNKKWWTFQTSVLWEQMLGRTNHNTHRVGSANSRAISCFIERLRRRYAEWLKFIDEENHQLLHSREISFQIINTILENNRIHPLKLSKWKYLTLGISCQ